MAELIVYSNKICSLLNVYVSMSNVKLFVNLNAVNLSEGKNLYSLCRELKLNYSYSLGLVHKFEDLELVTISLVGREFEIAFTEKGLELKELLHNFCNVFSRGLEV